MIEIFYKSKGQILNDTDVRILDKLGLDDVLWIDLHDPTGDEKRAAEDFLDTTLQSRAQAEEIESSSRYSETETTIFANTNFLIPGPDDYTSIPVSFILSESILVTLRHTPLRTLAEVQRKLLNNLKLYPTGYHIMVSILENRIDVDADLVEILSKEITQLSRRIDLGESMDETFLLDVNQLQENTMVIRTNGVDKQRILSGSFKSDKFPRDLYTKLEILNKDIDSLIHHANFSFERLEYLQNTALGLINLEQNKLMRVFTFVSLLLMPPTLIASIYGMNVKLPIVSGSQLWDFIILLLLMLLSVVIAIFLFKRRKMIK